jgi:hypothetical protein
VDEVPALVGHVSVDLLDPGIGELPPVRRRVALPRSLSTAGHALGAALLGGGVLPGVLHRQHALAIGRSTGVEGLDANVDANDVLWCSCDGDLANDRSGEDDFGGIHLTGVAFPESEKVPGQACCAQAHRDYPATFGDFIARFSTDLPRGPGDRAHLNGCHAQPATTRRDLVESRVAAQAATALG